MNCTFISSVITFSNRTVLHLFRLVWVYRQLKFDRPAEVPSRVI
jgi:hypothetical protein